MNWRLYRVEEGNGCVSNRIWFDSILLCNSVYGVSFYQGNKIILPPQIFTKKKKHEHEETWGVEL